MREFSALALAASDEFEATSRLAAIVESSTDAMIGKTLDGVITSWNAGAQRMYDYAAEEILGRNISVLIPCEIAMLLTDVVMPGASGKHLAADLRRMRPRTKVLYMSAHASHAIDLRAVSGPGLNLIEKPFTSDDLLHRVHEVLNNGARSR